MKRKVLDGEFLEKLESISLAVKGAMTGLYGGSRKAHGYGNTVEFADFREYVPGDDLRRIDWNVYARFEKYFIKLFTDERQQHHRIIVDCSASMATGKPEKAQTALRIATAFAYLAVCDMDRVSFQLLHGDHLEDLAGTMIGKNAVCDAALQLENVAFYGDTELEKAILNDPNPGYDDGMTIVISDFLTESNWKSMVDFLVFRHREILFVQLLSPEEVNPSLTGDVHLIDMESELPKDPRNVRMKISKGFLKAYHRALDDYRREISDFCHSRGASYLFATTDLPIEQILFQRGYETEVIK
jgi:uncharacterized protein (DUF58 family)